MNIPTNPDFSSLNIAAAAQVLCYEIRLATTSERVPAPERDSPLATASEQEGMYAHFEQALTELGFLKPENPGQLMRRLRRLFARAELEQLEVNVLRGIMNAALKGNKSNTS